MFAHYIYNENKTKNNQTKTKKSPKEWQNLSCQQFHIIILCYCMSETEVKININNFCEFFVICRKFKHVNYELLLVLCREYSDLSFETCGRAQYKFVNQFTDEYSVSPAAFFPKLVLRFSIKRMHERRCLNL